MLNEITLKLLNTRNYFNLVKLRRFNRNNFTNYQQVNMKRGDSTSSQQPTTSSKKSMKSDHSYKKEPLQERDRHSLMIHVVGNGYMSTPKSCLISTGLSHMLVNCGEGVSRSLGSHSKFRPHKIDQFLFTRFDWSVLGGFVNLTTDIAEFGVSNTRINIHAPVDFYLSEASKSYKKYFIAKEACVKQHDYAVGGEFDNNNFTVQRIDMAQAGQSKNAVWSYFVKCKKPMPNIDVDKLAQYKYKPGPWIEDLRKEIDYKSPSGEILVKARSVLDMTNCIEKNVLVLDMPTVEGIERVKASLMLNDQSSPIDVIIHMSKPEVLNSEPYMQWLRESYRNSKCIHLFLDESFPNIDMKRVYDFQAQLNLINQRLFPLLPVQQDEFKREMEEKQLALKTTQSEIKILQGQTGMLLKLRPQVSLDLANVIQLDNNKAREDVFSGYPEHIEQPEEELELLKEFRENANKLSANLPADASQQSCVIKYPRVVFLGTASAMPTLTRNVTSILVSTSASKSLLLDCGDYAIGQMHKFFGPKYIDAELVKIKGIYVSHSHQDHCQGLFGVVKARQQAFKNLNMSYEKLLIIHPITINHILSVASKLMFSENFSDIASTIPTEIFLFDPKEQADVMQSRPALLGLRFANTEKYLRALGLVDLKTVMVPHIQYTYAICLHMEIKNENEKDEAAASGDNNHFKLVFSADCRPSEQLIKAGKDCDLLIHECTFDNFNYEKAVKTRHSTIGEALEVSKEMNARHTVLTHFSARYSRFLITDQMNVDKSTFAFDFMSVTPDELSLLNKTTISKLNILFKEKMVMYEKSNPAKRQVQSSNYLGSKR